LGFSLISFDSLSCGMHFTVLPAQRSPAACSGVRTNQMAVAAGEQRNMQSSRWSSAALVCQPSDLPWRGTSVGARATARGRSGRGVRAALRHGTPVVAEYA